ncbi:hypothetical protein QN277_020189 [Acacia crassicarpa]|uniref:Uncharacterized protein n=1 Tax=Acacia crassicarpa TaxID=499986 RepID=A0AAE1JJ80_9FABA|nr:hypothetical protein QN277_020189 [Acacia crassicarpa]
MASTLLLAVVFVFDLVAFALAVAAEQKRSTSHIVQEGTLNSCRYNSNVATGLGVGSFIILVASQAIIMVVTRCLCGGQAMSPGRNRSWAIILFITSWVTFIIAALCLLAGSARNAHHTKGSIPAPAKPSCATLKKGVFGAGAAFIVFTGIASELYYVLYSKANSGPPPFARDSGVTMANM